MAADLITLSREFGAGASELAEALGARLGWRVLDREIPRLVARRLRLPEDSLDEWDEHAPRLLESIANSLLMGSPELVLDTDVGKRPLPRDVATATRGVIEEAAASPPLVIVGHGAQAIFARRERSIHVRLAAPVACRVKRIVARLGVSEQKATAMARYVDADRMAYVKEFFGCDVRDPLLYTMQLNTGRMAIADIAEVIAIEAGRTPGS